MADCAPVLIWMSGTDKLCSYFNKSWLDFTGRSLEQELGDGWADGVHPEDFQACVNTYVQHFDARKRFALEYRLRRFDGEYRWILDIGAPRFSRSGQFLGYIGSCIDITAQKELQRELRERSELLELAQTAAHIGIWSWNLETDKGIVNRQFWEILGLTSQADMSYGGFLNQIHPDDRERYSVMVEGALRGAGPIDIECRIVRADNGEIRWIASKGQVKFEKNREPVGAIGAIWDITSRKDAEEARRRSENESRLRQNELEWVFEHAPIGLGFFDLDLRYKRINKRLAEIGGASVEDHLGRLIDDVAPTVSAGAREVADKILNAKTDVITREVSLETPAQPGTLRHFRDNWYPVSGPEGRIVGIGVVVEEITEQKNADIALRENDERIKILNVELEDKVAKRTAELATANAELARLARRDALTGLPNRLAFDERISLEFASMKRFLRPYAILMIDIDHFKAVNDKYGHAIGDEVLRRTADIIHSSLRESDFLCRWGGEEILVILPSTQITSAWVVAEKIRKAVALSSTGEIPSVTISVGAAVATPNDSTVDVAVNQADHCLYKAKDAGRNRTIVAGNH